MAQLITADNAFNTEISQPELKVVSKGVYRGPHLYSNTPMVRIELDLGLLENWPTNKIPGFTDALIALVPSLQEHGCSYRAAGGFIRRMREGTWLGHVIEHVAIELQCLAGTPVSRGKTRSVKGKPGVYNVMYEYAVEEVGLAAGRVALEIVNSLLPPGLNGVAGLESIKAMPGPFTDIATALAELKRLVCRHQLGPTTKSIVDAARKRGIPAIRLDKNSLVQLGWGKAQRRIRGSITDGTSNIAVETAGDKDLTKQVLSSISVPVPRGAVVRDWESALRTANDLGYPVVIKPLDGNHGRGVSTNICNEADLKTAYDLAREHGSRIVVEQFCKGRDYRVLVIGYKVAAVAERIPAHVTGDGVSTIAQLVERINQDPRRGDGHESVLSRIVLDDQVDSVLARSGLTRSSVPEIEQKIHLRDTANLSTGGTAIDRTNDIHPDTIAVMERAAKAIGLDIAGIDLVCPDISRALSETGGGIVEVNASPGFRMHLAPSEGAARPVGEYVVDMMFPEGTEGRIPIAAITGTNGKSTTARLVAHIGRQTGRNVGLTTTSGIQINDQVLWAGDASGPQSARCILSDPTVDMAVLETARGGILREGLAYDGCDVGAVLNVTADHLGLKGIMSLEDLAAVKSVVAESVKRNGVSVLNADDPATLGMMEHAGGQICLFSVAPRLSRPGALEEHLNAGGMAVLREYCNGRDAVVLYKDGRKTFVADVRDIGITFEGTCDFNIQNAVAATAIALGLGIDIDAVRRGLFTFLPSYELNPGRMNVHDSHGFRIVMDYAHNPAGLRACFATTNKMRPNYLRVIGTVSTPGDRRDEDIREMGAIAVSGLDCIVFREDPDRRGRPPGEVLRLLKEGALSAGCPEENIICVPGEDEAVDICLKKARMGDMVLLFPSMVEECWKAIQSFDRIGTFSSRDNGKPVSLNA